MRTLMVPLIAMTLFAACRDQGPEIPSFDGRWTGFVLGMNIEFVANEVNGNVTGAGMFVGPAGVIAFSISGVHTHPEVAFNIASSGYADANFMGSFSGDNRIVGRLNGAGFINDSLTLGRP